MESIFETMRMLRAARVLLDLSQQELSERAGVGRQTVVRIEHGEKGVSADAIEKVRVALEKSGVVFLPSTVEHGPAVALRRKSTVK